MKGNIMKGIYRFKADVWYTDLQGIFVATEKEIENLIGEYVYFGEVGGKHSEVEGEIEEKEIELVTNDPKAVKMFEKYNMETGINPLKELEEMNDENE